MSIRSPQSSETVTFIVLSILIMMFVKVVMIDGVDSYLEKAEIPKQRVIQEEVIADKEPIQIENGPETSPLEVAETPLPSDFDFSDFLSPPIEEKAAAKEAPIKMPKPPAKFYPPKWDGKSKGKVVLIIDDMGMAKKYTQDVIDLPSPMTLAFLPYATGLDEYAKESKSKGHELIIHVPMEPIDSSQNLGPAGLTTKLDRTEFLNRLDNNIFNSFGGYVGINNHMGSRLTQDKQAMSWLMPELKKRGLFYVDSKTISTSVAAKMAHAYSVDYAERDVFLDHNEDLQSVMKALYRTEKVAHQKGYAIAIGHPKKNTIEGIKRWMVGMEERGLELVPVSEVLTRFEKPKEIEMAKKPEIIWNDVPAMPPKTSQIEFLAPERNALTNKLLKLQDTEPAAGEESPLDFIYLGEEHDIGSIRNQY